jgi:flagellar secretion chaperone FliS
VSGNDLFKEYKKNQIINADQAKLILMLYDGAIKFINRALELMPKKKAVNLEDIHKNIIKAQDIISELTSSLNMDAGDISHRLFSIYMYINQRLIDANIKKEEKPLVEAKKYLLELRGAWEKAGKTASPDNKNNKSKEGSVNIAT